MPNGLSKNDFVVRESLLINGIVIGFFILILIGLTITSIFDREHAFSLYVGPIAMVLCTILISLKNALSKSELIRINNAGIFYRTQFVTDWNSFYFAFISDEAPPGRLHDDFRLVLQYYGANGTLVETRLPMPNSQDKSGYQVLDAIKRFSRAEQIAST